MNSVATGHDFSDRLNPYLVKELRQGLRARTYQSLFLLLILALSVQSMLRIGVPEASSKEFFDGLFRIIVGGALAALLPMGTLGAIHEERRGRKIELVMLTRVKARGVVLGKWIVACIQSLTLASLIAPFMVLRYFSGGVNFVTELVYLVVMMLAGQVLAAAAICASSFIREGMPVIGFLVRGGLIAGCVFAGFGLSFGVTDVLDGNPDKFGLMLGMTGAVLALGVPPLIEIGASKLAPEAVNHDGLIRLIAVIGGGLSFLVIIGLGFLAGARTSDDIWIPAILTAFTYCMVVSTFTFFGRTHVDFHHSSPLANCGRFLHRAGNIFLLPGYGSGLAWSVLMLLPVLPLLAWLPIDRQSDRYSVMMYSLQLWAALMWPLAVTTPFIRRPVPRFIAWGVLQILAVVIAVSLVGGRYSSGLKWNLAFIPSIGLFTGAFADVSAYLTSFIGFFLTLGAVAIAVIVYAVRSRRVESLGS